MSKGKNKRKREIRELVREIEMQRASRIQPPSRIEVIEYSMQREFDSMVRKVKKAMYHRPSQSIIQPTFDSQPKKSLSQVLKEFNQRINDNSSSRQQLFNISITNRA
jgi:hypothetical protein